MIKKLFLSFKVLAAIVYLCIATHFITIIYRSSNSVRSFDVVIYRMKSDTQKVHTNLAEEASKFELSLVETDKRKNFFTYNEHDLTALTLWTGCFLLIFALEKWLFWLLRKDEPVKTRSESA
jgi:hypothetical protein